MSAVAQALTQPLTAPRPAVHKFGGTSLGSGDAVRRCANILAGELERAPAARIYAIVSAARGVTDALLDLTENSGSARAARLAALRERVRGIARTALHGAERANFEAALDDDIAHLDSLLAFCNTLRGAVPHARDEIAAHGELWSVRLLIATLAARGIDASAFDARLFLRLQTDCAAPAIDWELSERLFAEQEPSLPHRLVIVPGYIARIAEHGPTATLGRNGSDWSATIVGRLANAGTVTIWSDVAGVLEADPRVVPDARPHAVIGREAAARLAAAGARVLHPATLAPLENSDAHICVRNSFEPDAHGTLIVPQGGLSGAVVTAAHEAERAQLGAVGRNALPARALAALDNARIAYDTAQAEPESVRIGIAGHDAVRAQRVLHRALCRERRSASVVLLGTGNVGTALLQLLTTRATPQLELLGVANSRLALFERAGLAPGEARQRLHDDGAATNLDELAARLLRDCEAAPVVIDATASEAVAKRHADWLAAGIHVVTANKLAAANGWIDRANRRCRYGDAATVGAGLPVLAAIRRLRAGGDTIVRVEGILSGSLAHVFHALENEQPFSAAVLAAQRAGFAEPDPRQDLSGTDVARKLSILGFAAGLACPTPAIEPLLPKNLAALPTADFLQRLHEADAGWQTRARHAHERGAVLRHVARLDANGAAIGVREIRRDDPLARTRGTDNCVCIYSHAYEHDPLIVQGPGAGATVTAQALLTDVAEIVACFGA